MNNESMIELLLTKKARSDFKPESGRTMMEEATAAKDAKIVELLRKKIARKGDEDEEGEDSYW